MENYAIGIDIGGTSIKGAVLSKNGRPAFLTSVPTEAEKGGKRVLGNVLALIESLIDRHGTRKNILGIGIGTPGAVNAGGAVIGGAQNLPGWEGTNIIKPTRKRFGLPVKTTNDAVAMTLAEWRFGAGKGLDNIVCLTLGTGIGGGIVANGRIYKGACGLAGELGHISVDYNGLPCSCGQRGCLECYASAAGIVRMAIGVCAGFSKNRRTAFSKLVAAKPRDLTSKIVYDYVKKRDTAALRINEMVCEKLARIVGVTINAFAPDRVILGGGVMNAGKIIIDTTWKYVSRYSLSGSRSRCALVKARCGEKAGVIGAAQLVFEEMGRDKNV
ncbi:MAG: ROK family protein [Chitinivibrionales bacterium]